MNEYLLRDYFEDKILADALNADVEGSRKRTGYDTTTTNVTQIESNQVFLISRSHLLKLCTDCLNEAISAENLSIIAFALFGSEYFTWEANSDEGKIVETTLFDWDNPNLNFELTKENLELWKEYLQTGRYRLK